MSRVECQVERGTEKIHEEENNGLYSLRHALCALRFRLCAAAEESPTARVSCAGDAASESTRSEPFRLACASLATSKDRTSPSSTDTQRGSAIGLLP